MLALLFAIATTQAQNPFFEVVNYRGAFAPAPASPWTQGWTNFDPQSTVYPAVTDTVSANITANTTWTTGKTYLLRGLIYVKNGATLTIQPGVIVKGDATVSGGTALVITKGAKINAVGTSTSPVVFTSSKDTGARAVGDWGGVIMLGKASLNRAGGVANIEGIATSTDTEYGGGTTPDDNDNSGNLKYARIEFGGYIFATDQEINGLTMGAIGRNTIIDFVQTSFINDDAFEWFGGTVNCSHLVAFRSVDDDFDTDFGYSGSVQFALGVRDPNLSDQSSGSTSEGFESDNDGSGSTNTPITSAVFSNVTWIGAYRGTVGTSTPSGTFKFRRAVRIRRNSRLKVLNSIFTDAPYGVFIDGAANRGLLQNGNGVFKNNIIAGCFRAVEPGTSTGLTDSLFNNAQFNNDSLVSTTGLLESPYDFVNGDYRPASSSIALSDVNFTDAAFNNRKIIVSAASYIREVSYRGAFAPSPSVMWTDGWAEWNPQSKVYPAVTDTVSANITANTTWTSDKTYLLNGVIYVTAGVTLTIQPGTVIKGNAAVSGGTALVITKNAKIIAQGTVDAPIVFTSSRDTGARATGDWGGVIILGRAGLNRPGGVANIEGIAASTNTEYGGGASPNDNDNSGILTYARIEYGGYIFATDQEINGLTLGAVGRGTQIDHIQTSFINDDSFEWFGGTVNCSYLVAYRGVDDDFDTDFGYSGSVQFALAVRDPNLSDQSSGSTSEGFESDNDGSGSTNTPITKALFSNVTVIGPYRGTVGTSAPSGTFKFRRAVRIRRNSRLKLFNSIFTDFPYGVFIDGAANRGLLQNGNGKFKNNLIAGCFRAVEPGTASTLTDSLFSASFFKNDSLATTANVLTTPYNFFAPDYRPGSNPLATTGAAFTDSAFNGLILPCDEVNAPGVMTGAANIAGCTNPVTYSIPAISNATSYIWSVPAGATIVSGQGTRTITVNFATALTAAFTGTVSVTGRNDCGNSSTPATKTLSKIALGVPGVITAPAAPFATNVCSVVGRDTALTYSIAAVAGAVNYAWTAPANTTIVTGQGTRTITLKFDNGYTTALKGDTLKVVVSSSCATAAVKTLAIKASVPAAPTAITIAPVVTNVCGARKYRYSMPVNPAGTTGYEWSFIGSLYSTATIDSGDLNGRVIVINYTSNAAAATGDSVKARYIAACGNGVWKASKLSNLALSKPAAPSAITIQAVAQNVCGARQYRYSAPNLPVATATAGAATGWNWELVGSLAEFASIDSGDINTQKILVTYTVNTAAATGDSVKLFYSSACGNTAVKASKLSNTALKVPTAPASITVQNIQTNVCGARKYRYIAPALPAATTTAGAATGYEWSFVGSLASTLTIDSGSLTSRTLTVTYTSNAAAAAGDSVRVLFTSDCGNSLRKTSKLSNLALGKPLAPATLTIQTKSDVCGARTYRYIAPAVLPVATATAGAADGYLWTAPFGTVGSTGTIDSGDVNSRIITVTYTSNAAAAAGDSIKLQYTSGCGNGAFKASKLSNLAKTCLTSGTEIFTRNTNNKVKATVYPNPNNGTFALTATTGVTAKTTATVQVIDMLGKVVNQSVVENNNGMINTNINSNLNNGVYTVKIMVGNVTNTVRMVVQK